MFKKASKFTGACAADDKFTTRPSLPKSGSSASVTGGAGFDLVFDSVGGANMLTSFEAAKLNGSVATTVALVELDLSAAHFKGVSLHVVFMLIPMMHNVGRERHGAILKDLASIVDAGGLTPLLDPSDFNLEQVGDAYAKLESGNAIGKIVITI